MNIHTQDWFHGSSSASLPGVLRNDGGLKPTGGLLRAGGVPFSGELRDGMDEGAVNQSLISVVPPARIGSAADYAKRYAQSEWNPHEGKENIAWYEQGLAQIERGEKASFRGLSKRVLERWVMIERRRLEEWMELSQIERSFISNPFPVIYGIRNAEDALPVTSSYRHEHGVSAVAQKNLTLYVPAEKIDTVQRFSAERGVQADIHAIEELLVLQEIGTESHAQVVSCLQYHAA